MEKRYVDGKSLAIELVAFGECPAVGRILDEAELDVVDKYISKCKLGRFRPGRAKRLKDDIARAQTQEERSKAISAYESFKVAARKELQKCRHIQKIRKEVGSTHL